MKRPAIKLKARGFFLADGRMLVTPSFDSVKEKPHFRLPGGQIEFGERSEVTLAREMREEFAADVEVLELLDVVQNVFYYEGRQRHEVVFIHRGRFVDEAFLRRSELPNIEPGSNEVSKWLPVADVLNGRIPLFPLSSYERWVNLEAGPE
jgi:ADP-ribose pyrophosphatase YjhB (NUDIX family)